MALDVPAPTGRKRRKLSQARTAARQSPAYQSGLVKFWNERHGVPTRVVYRKDNGELEERQTRSDAQLLGGHTAVIWLEGIAGCVALERVTALDPATDTLPRPEAPAQA